jgi:hypothetical protein
MNAKYFVIERQIFSLLAFNRAPQGVEFCGSRKERRTCTCACVCVCVRVRVRVHARVRVVCIFLYLREQTELCVGVRVHVRACVVRVSCL